MIWGDIIMRKADKCDFSTIGQARKEARKVLHAMTAAFDARDAVLMPGFQKKNLYIGYLIL